MLGPNLAYPLLLVIDPLEELINIENLKTPCSLDPSLPMPFSSFPQFSVISPESLFGRLLPWQSRPCD